MNWSTLFKNEEELLKKLSEIDVHLYHELCDKKVCNGYQSITSLVRKINSGQPLADIQMASLKKQATEVKKYHAYLGTLE